MYHQLEEASLGAHGMTQRKAKATKIKLHLTPTFSQADKADGGVRRVWEAQRELLPEMGFDLVSSATDCDIIGGHIFDERASWFRENSQVPIVAHNHGMYWQEGEYQWEKWAIETNLDIADFLQRADAVTAPTEWVSNILRRGLMKPVVTIGHGVRMAEWPEPASYDLAPSSYVLWNKTRVDAVCDPKPMAELADMVRSVQFITTMSGAHSNRGNVRETGPLPYEQGKVLVAKAGVYLCTTRETFGIGTIEAMAAGVPILGWAWGGQAEFVQHGETGWLCAPGDVQGLAEGLEYCLRNRSRLGKAARSYVAGSLTWDLAIARYAELYTKVLDETRTHRWVPQAATIQPSPGVPSPSDKVGSPSGTMQPTFEMEEGSWGKGVSVVIPCYKLERYLTQAVESALAALPGCEVIIVDDCSPGDESGTTAAMVAEATGATYLKTPANLYLAGALNYGISAANGDLIVPLDADNYLNAGIRECVRELRKGRSHSIAYGAVHFIDVDAEGQEVKSYGSDWPGEFSFPMQIRGANQVPSTCVYRKDVWARIGGYRSRCRTAEDADFWCRASSYCGRPIKATSQVTFTYRNRMDSMSHVEESWGWNLWYSWSRKSAMVPMGAALSKDEMRQYLRVKTFEPLLVSVIIPVGPGHQRYLPDAIDSVVAQTFGQWELIIVNDTGESSLGWVPPFARVVATPGKGKPQGAGAARNLGLSVARGRTFLFLDADDYLQPEALETLYQVYRRPRESGGGGIVYGDFYEQGGLNQPDPKLHVWEHDTTDATGRAVLSMAYIPVTFLAPMAAVGRGEGLAWFDESMELWEDWDFLWQLHANGWCAAYVPSPVFNYCYKSGHRREAVSEAARDYKDYMAEKWGSYLIGHGVISRPGVKGKELMSCGSCRGGGTVNWASAMGKDGEAGLDAMLLASGQTGDTVKVEYIGTNLSTVEYRHPVSGRKYRFDASQSGKVNAVNREDLTHFLQYVDRFRLFGVSGDPALPSPSAALLAPAR